MLPLVALAGMVLGGGTREAIRAVVVVGSVALEGHVVFKWVAHIAVDPRVKFDDEGRVEDRFDEPAGAIEVAVSHVAAIARSQGAGTDLLHHPGDAVGSAVVGAQVHGQFEREGMGDVEGAVVPCRAALGIHGRGQLDAVGRQFGRIFHHRELGGNRTAEQKKQGQTTAGHGTK